MDQSPVEYRNSNSSIPTTSTKLHQVKKDDKDKISEQNIDKILKDMIKLMVQNTVNTLNKLSHVEGELTSTISDHSKNSGATKLIDRLDTI